MSHDEHPRVQPNDLLGRIYQILTTVSQYIVYIAVLMMMLVMGAEVFMRYVVTQPLGWNISLLENILMPGLVFLGLPWAYAISAHVAAGMVYDRLPLPVQRALDWLTRVVVIICAAFLIYAGAKISIDAFMLGSVPPPLSAQVNIPTWVWRSFLPIGTAMMLVLVLIDLLRLPAAKRTES